MTLDRERLLRAFLDEAGWARAQRRQIAGDASTRRYERLSKEGGQTAILMDAPKGPDGPPLEEGLPYSKIAHLAEDCLPFVAVGGRLRALGLSAPELIAHDLDRGFLLLEDLGDGAFGPMAQAGKGADALYEAAVDVLIELHAAPVPRRLTLPGGGAYEPPPYDARAMEIEASLLADWYAPHGAGRPLSESARSAYASLWRELIAEARSSGETLTLRDYHSPNLLWLPEREGLRRLGLLDFQDAVIGPPAYDLVSLLQDARIDVPEEREATMLAYYVREAGRRLEDFDEARFRSAYAILGAQRNAKIIGIFTRLWKRDGKDAYLKHLPRVLAYFERDVAAPALRPLSDWLAAHLPAEARRVPVAGGCP